MSSPRPVILCFVKYYLPGYRSGGPLRTIVNFIEHFGDEFDIRIVMKCSPKIGQLVKLAKTLKPSSQHEAEAQKIQPRV